MTLQRLRAQSQFYSQDLCKSLTSMKENGSICSTLRVVKKFESREGGVDVTLPAINYCFLALTLLPLCDAGPGTLQTMILLCKLLPVRRCQWGVVVAGLE